MIKLNQNQKRRILSVFEHIEELMDDIEKTINAPRSAWLFKKYLFDIPVERRQELRQEMSEFRTMMSRNLGIMDIRPEFARISAIQAAITRLMFINTALRELKSGYLSGYGGLEQESATKLDRMILQMQRVIARIRTRLSVYSDGNGKKSQE